MPTVEHPLTSQQRADIVTARETIKRTMAGETDADLPAAAAMLDRVLASSCPHDPSRWYRTTDASGRVLITCAECGVSWTAPVASGQHHQ